MVNEPRRIKITPGSEIARLLAEAAGSPVILEKNGEAYRVTRVLREREGSSSGYDPEAAREAILKAAGSWKDVDVDAFKSYVSERRRSSSRPPVHL